jgi:hypothetical protein
LDFSADKTYETVAYYQRLNNNAPMRVNRVDVVRMAWARMDNQPYTAYAQPENWKTVCVTVKPKQKKRKHIVNIGKVLGSMYTEWEARETESNFADEIQRNIAEKDLRAFFTEYKSRLSKTIKKRFVELVRYVNSKSKMRLE